MNSKKMFLTVAAVILLASTVMADSYQLDTQKSSVTWTGKKAIGTTHTGNLQFKEGALDVTNNQLVSALFVVDMATLTDKDLAKKPDMQKKLVGHLKSADFFNVEKFPTSTFKVTKAEKKSDDEKLKAEKKAAKDAGIKNPEQKIKRHHKKMKEAKENAPAKN